MEINNLRGRYDLPALFKDMGFKVGAEVGVYKAAFTESFCKEGFKMYAIDPWMAYQGAGRTQNRQLRQDFLYEHAHRVLDKYDDCTIIRKTSVEAAKDFKDGSLDFVYLDGDHSFKHIAQDLAEWTPKVRAGGIVSGHDYFNRGPRSRNLICQVKNVVDAYVKSFEIDSLVSYGGQKDAPNKDDRYPSWLFINK